MISLKHVAAEAGVSVMAVSKALRDAPDISARTKQRIREIADRLGYVPNGNARGLRNRRTHTIGVVVPDLAHGAFGPIVSGIIRDASDHDYRVLVAQSQDQCSIELREIRALVGRQVDGLIIAPASRFGAPIDFLELTTSRDIPVVFIDRCPPGFARQPKTAALVAEDRAGAELATAHLMEHGHRRILHLAGPAGCMSTEERLAGYRRAMGTRFDDGLVFRAGTGLEDGEKAMVQALDEGAEFTAVFAFNDHVAIGAAELLLNQGRRIPHDVSVVGFGDVTLARHFRVPLTTVRHDPALLGQRSVTLLLKLLQGERPENQALPVSLIPRLSVGRPSAASAPATPEAALAATDR